MSYKVLYNPAILINEMILAGAQGEPFGGTPLLRCYLVCVVPSL